jgi:hypothetical protein
VIRSKASAAEPAVITSAPYCASAIRSNSRAAALSRFDHAISAGIYCLSAIGPLMRLVITAASSVGSTGLTM